MACIEKVDKTRSRVVLVTQGADPVIFSEYNHVTGKGYVDRFPIRELRRDKIVDTNGAGDSFVGGFLSERALGSDMLTSLKKGGAMARKIVQSVGCNLKD